MPRIGPRIVTFLVLLLLTIPAVYYGTTYLNNPDLCPGDELVERSCRNCGGGGKDPQFAEDYPGMGDRCMFCRGKGTVRVILPGPLRPSRVHGAIFDMDAQSSDPFGMGGGPRMGSRVLMPLAGGIPRASVILTSEGVGEPILLTTNSKGRFLAKVPQGVYTVTTTAPGFYDEERELEVPVLTEPIWLEFATLLEEPQSMAHEQTLYGIELRVPMERR